jgi:hypothetical protein
MSTISRLRAPAARGLLATEAEAPQIDREAGVIRGASAMQAVEALGHEVLADIKTLDQVAALGNAAKNGIKVRFTHPGMCSDGMGKMLGRMRDFRLEGDKVVGDIHLSDSAAKTPDGDLRGYVLDLAEEDPSAFGMSVVVQGDHAWPMADGSEVIADAKPKGAVGDMPRLRVSKLHAVDVVDEPAANRDGLFSAAFAGTSNEAAAEVFALFDQARARFGLNLEKAKDFASRYFVARAGVVVDDVEPAGKPPAQNPKGDRMDKESLKALRQAHPGHDLLILEMFADGKSEAEMVGAIQTATLAAEKKAAEALKADLAKTEADLAAEKAKAEKLATDKGELEKKLADLTSLAAGAAKDPGQDAGTDANKPIEGTSAELAAGKYSSADIRSGRVVIKA